MSFNIDLDDLSLDEIGSWPLSVKVFACVFIALAIFVAGYFLDTKNQLIELSSAQRTEKQLRQEFEKKQHQSASLDAYRMQLIEIRKSFGALLKQLPSKTEVPGLLEDISKTGVASGLEFQLFDPLEEIKHDFYAELPIKIVVIGDYHQFGDFVSRLSELHRIVTLHDFRVRFNDTKKPTSQTATQSKDLLKQPRLVMELMAKTYRYIDLNEQMRDQLEKARNKDKKR